MNIATWTIYATKVLQKEGIGSARLDALILLEDCLGIDRAKLLAEPERKISADDRSKLEKLLKRRAIHEPLAYIRGHTEFYGRTFVINHDVLEPRPESETMIDMLLDLNSSLQESLKSPSLLLIADIGTGSGALGITAQLELPDSHVELIELDKQAIETAKTNVDKFTLDISVIESDLLEQTTTAYDILLCNLPYVPDNFQINQAAGHEPRMAIFGGSDGLDLYRKLFIQLGKRQEQVLYILTESLPPQHEHLASIACEHGYLLEQANDFIQLFRHAKLTTPN